MYVVIINDLLTNNTLALLYQVLQNVFVSKFTGKMEWNCIVLVPHICVGTAVVYIHWQIRNTLIATVLYIHVHDVLCQ